MPPIRFFCKRCNLMIKIGAQMAGRNVVCPQCTAKILVPQRSDPQAEALYQFLKEKRAREKADKIIASLDPAQQTQPAGPPCPAPSPAPEIIQTPQPEPIPSAAVDGPRPEYPADTNDSMDELEDLEPDEVDGWIEEFWATVPETEGLSNRPRTLRNAAANDSEHGENEQAEMASSVSRYQQTVLLFRVWLMVVFLIGLVAGIYLHSVYADWRLRHKENASHAGTEHADATITVSGNLYHRDFDGRPTADADAVVIVLPQKSVPKIPITVDGLRPNDELFDPNGDSVQQIIEIGGAFQRTGTGGEFSLPLKKSGKYLVMMVSSHAKRDEAKPTDPTVIRELRVFFRNPTELIGEYRYALEEYDFQRGHYVLKETF